MAEDSDSGQAKPGIVVVGMFMRFGTFFFLSFLLLRATATGEIIRHITFSEDSPVAPLRHTWGDKPSEVMVNGTLPAGGFDGAGACLKLRFGEDAPNNLSYWTQDFPEPVPIVEELEELSFRVKTNVPIQIKVPISPFGFIYHGPGVKPSDEWRKVTLRNVWGELSAWCARGKKDSGEGWVPGLILAIGETKNALAEIYLDDVVASGAEGVNRIMGDELRRRRFKRIRASVVTLPWSAEGRSLEVVLDRLDEAGMAARSHIVCLPMECVQTSGEEIPGPISLAIAAKAAEHGMYVIGNIRERSGERTYVTSFLCNREGEIVGTYRKSHKMPDEDMALGDELPVFQTDFGPIAMRIGSDRYFADMDHVYTAKGARMIFWSQMPEPVEDEHLQDFPSAGRAQDYNVFIACARYSFAGKGWITNKFPPYRGCPIGRSYVFNREGQRVACTPRKGTVATAVIPANELRAPGRGPSRNPAFACLTAPVQLPEKRDWAKRKIRVTSIQNHIGIEDLLAKLDQAGEMGSDIVCTYEFVWIPVHGRTPNREEIENKQAVARKNRERVAAKAKQWNMYVILCGVIETREINEAIVYGRDGNEIGRYRKIATTYPEQIPGTETTVLETDFGRIAVRICADNYLVEQDRAYGVKGADIVFFSTQDWGPDAIYRNLREISRGMDAQMFHVQATHSSTEVLHRSMIVDPAGVPVTRSRHRFGGLISAVIDLDNDRPRRYVRTFRPHTPAGYLPQYQPTELPEVRNDLKETILRQRRPELYQILAPTVPAPKAE